MLDVLILPGFPSDMNLDYGPGIVRACFPYVPSCKIRIEAGRATFGTSLGLASSKRTEKFHVCGATKRD